MKPGVRHVGFLAVVSSLLALPASASLLAHPRFARQCVKCHEQTTPNIVSDWRLSAHSQNDVSCAECHGGDVHCAQCHGDGADVRTPTPDTCAGCHEDRVEQFRQGKHAKAWTAMNAMPSAHAQPIALTEGTKGCRSCHKIGLKTEDEIKELKESGAGFGTASCDACHKRHSFSVKEARQPEACQPCHMGFALPQGEMYSSSKHGVLFLMTRNKTPPEPVAAPTCQTCHMQEGNHALRTAWGFFAVRLPMPEDQHWTEDRATILQALGVFDPEGNPTARLEVVKAVDVVRLTQEDWQNERDKMLGACGQCHSVDFAREEVEKGDAMIKETDHLLAEAIRIVAGLYQDGILDKPESFTYAFPDLMNFHEAPTIIGQKLFDMHLEHRVRAIQGTFHTNPDYALQYGLSPMRRTLTEIIELAQELRQKKEEQ